jgi:ketosteroid isomerase-like protein
VDAALRAADTWRAVSQQNLEVVRRLVALWEGDAQIASLRDDAAWALYKPEIEPLFEPDCTFAWIGGGIGPEHSGLDGFREGWLDIYAAWESGRNHFEQIVPVGDKVLVLVRLSARIVETEHEVETLAASVFVVRDGRVARAEFYANRADALEAVGLRE